MKYESIEKFLADARQYLGLEAGAGKSVEERHRQSTGFSGAGDSEQWNLSQPSDDSVRSPE